MLPIGDLVGKVEERAKRKRKRLTKSTAVEKPKTKAKRTPRAK